ncbi:MAG: carboxypeptidase-like regulatory domain-containing protein [Fibrobacteria bacterium]
MINVKRRKRIPDIRRVFSGFVLSLLGLLGMSGCIQGGGTDIGNALVMGTVMDGGNTVAGAKVVLMPEGYNPVLGDSAGTGQTTFTDGQGRFTLKGVRPGRYSLETRHPLLERMDWVRILDVEAGGTHVAEPEMAGARTVLVRLPENAAPDAYIFIPGTDVYALRASGDTTGDGRIRLPHVPAEAVPTMGLGRSGQPEEVLFFEISLGAGDSTVVLESR